MNDDLEAQVRAQFAAARRAGPAPFPELGLAGLAVAPDRDPARFEAEQERVLRQAWLPLVRASELSERGSFASLDLAGDALAVVRGEDGTLHAFHDVCLHRGARLLREPRGCVDELRCPYHDFRYALDGRLSSAPEVAAFEPGGHGARRLAPVAVAEWGGWVWLHLGAAPPALESFLGAELLDELDEWPLSELEHRVRSSSDCDFGWKVGVEAFLEPLHVPTVHPRSAHPMVDFRRMVVRFLGPHSRMALPFRASNAWSAEGPMGAAALEAGVPVFPRLRAVQLEAHFVYHLFPATVLLLMPNHVLACTFLPLTRTRCRVVYELLAPPAVDDVSEAYLAGLVPGYDKLIEEDLENLPWIQRGLEDSSYELQELSGFEVRIRHFRAELERRLTSAD